MKLRCSPRSSYAPAAQDDQVHPGRTPSARLRQAILLVYHLQRQGSGVLHDFGTSTLAVTVRHPGGLNSSPAACPADKLRTSKEIKVMYDLIVAAIQTDMTRVVTYHLPGLFSQEF
ncbi:DUF1552 domain-containing protein [Lignipirellula cremea]|nr:DUF1552 domain-containing protein [Lignipirellula cremea]